MKTLTLYRLVTYQFLSSLVVLLVAESDGVLGKSDVKTKHLLQNIRTRLAQKADEIVKKKECESGLIFCKSPRSKEGEDDKSEEIPPPPKLVRGQHKPAIRVSTKDVVQTFMTKAHKSLYRKLRKVERVEDNEKHKKLFHSSEATDVSERSKEDKSDEVKPHITTKAGDIKKSTNIIKQPPKKDEKLSSNVKLPKFTKTDLKPDPSLPSAKKVPKEITKTEEQKNITKLVEKKKGVEKNGKVKDKTKATLTKITKDKKTSSEDSLSFLPGAFIFVLDTDDVENSLCRKHSQIYLKQLKKYQIWALMMYDASAKITSGFLQGNVNQYGDFDECLAINAVFKNLKNKPSLEASGIKGKYCLANVDMKTDSESPQLRVALERVESFQFIKSSIHDPAHFIPRFSTINWGVCVPSACLAEDVEKFLKYRLESFNFTGLQFDVNVEEENCVVKDNLKFKFQTETLLVILFYVTVLSISLYATFLDAKTPKKPKQLPQQEKTEDETPAKDICRQDETELSGKYGKTKKILMAFSLKKNLEKLLSNTNKGGIECINGIKSVFTIMLYFAHKTIPLGMTPFSNRVFLTKISNQPITILLRASIIYTDSFLLISGILTSYNLSKEISNKKISWAKKSIARYIRLTPALFAVVLFYAYIWHLLGSGPIWNPIINKNSSLCRKYMWRNLLYIQNFFAFENMCAPQTHQLALDMQLSLLAPLFVHLMHTYDKAGVGILQALFILSSILRYITASNNNLSVVIYHGMSVSQLYKTANLLYGQAIHRASPYILGTIVGYYLRRSEKLLGMPKAFAALGWILSFTFGFYSVMSPSPLALRAYQYDVQEAAQYAALSPVTWSLALSWLIVACHLGFGGILNDFLCQRIFLVFSRISYSVYLTQFLVFFYKVGVTRIPELFSFSGTINVTELLLVVVISVIVTLLFDFPMMEIKRIIFEDSPPTIPSEGDSKSESDVPPTEYPTEDESEVGTDSQESTDFADYKEKEEGEYHDEEVDEEQIDDVEADEEQIDDVEADEEQIDDGEADEEQIDDGEADEEQIDDGEADEEADGDADEEQVDDEEDEGEEENDENAADIETEPVVEEVFEIRPLRRSTRMHFSDDTEDKKFFKIEPEVKEEEE